MNRESQRRFVWVNDETSLLSGRIQGHDYGSMWLMVFYTLFKKHHEEIKEDWKWEKTRKKKDQNIMYK